MAGQGGGADRLARFIQSIIEKHDLSPMPFVPVNKAGGSGAEALIYMNERAGDPHVPLSFVQLLDDGGDLELGARGRAHANVAEIVPDADLPGITQISRPVKPLELEVAAVQRPRGNRQRSLDSARALAGPNPMLLLLYADTLVMTDELDRALAVADEMSTIGHREVIRARVAQKRGNPELKHLGPSRLGNAQRPCNNFQSGGITSGQLIEPRLISRGIDDPGLLASPPTVSGDGHLRTKSRRETNRVARINGATGSEA